MDSNLLILKTMVSTATLLRTILMNAQTDPHEDLILEVCQYIQESKWNDLGTTLKSNFNVVQTWPIHSQRALLSVIKPVPMACFEVGESSVLSRWWFNIEPSSIDELLPYIASRLKSHFFHELHGHYTCKEIDHGTWGKIHEHLLGQPDHEIKGYIRYHHWSGSLNLRDDEHAQCHVEQWQSLLGKLRPDDQRMLFKDTWFKLSSKHSESIKNWLLIWEGIESVQRLMKPEYLSKRISSKTIPEVWSWWISHTEQKKLSDLVVHQKKKSKPDEPISEHVFTRKKRL